MYAFFSFLLLASSAAAGPQVRQAVQGTSFVNLANNTGAPAHLASGFIYGIPDTPNQIPDHFYTDMGFNFGRSGGAQVAAPGRGWIWGVTEYKNRFASALSNYRTARKYGARFVLNLSDLWGFDSLQSKTATSPGQNGDWSSYDNYLTHVIADIKTNNMTPGLNIDIWNEPDLSSFWVAPQAQHLQMWGKAWHRLRTELPGVKLTGPTYSRPPTPTESHWTNFLSFVAKNGSVPDEYVWHMETSKNDMPTTTSDLDKLLATYGLPRRPLNMDEYGTRNEQCPAGSVWWISQLERVNAIGLRGNWLPGLQLHDLMASLVSKPNLKSGTSTGYFPNGDYQVYKYYNLNMTGYRVGTTPSQDMKLDTYATVSPTTVKIICGSRIVTGTWQVTITGLSKVGLPTSGTLNIHTWGFPFTGHYGRVDGPNDLGVAGHKYSGDSVTFQVSNKDNQTAYAFEFARP